VSEQHKDSTAILSALAQSRPMLELGTVDLCFLAALHLRADGAALVAFDEDRLHEVFQAVCSVLDLPPENVRRRATHAIQRLRDQKMLARVDGAGVLRAGEYALTRLAAAIVECYLSDESLNRENLTLLTRTLRASLLEILSLARRAKSEQDFREGVEGPLRVTVADLVSGIERRQRSLDLEQEEFQREIGKLLEADWFGALERCQTLLESTSQTLSELNTVLLRDAHELSSVLQDIQEVAQSAKAQGAEACVQRVVEQVDRITSWGAARQRAWSEYYQYVQRYLCDVVRLDPSRALTERLREQLSGHASHPFALSVARALPMRLLRELEPLPEDKPPARRPRAEREREPAPHDAPDPLVLLEEKVRTAIGEGALELSAVTTQVASQGPVEERFLTAGRVAQLVARLERPAATRDRPWRPVAEGLVIEDWRLPRAGGSRD
jgi:chromosome partition protein MukF